MIITSNKLFGQFLSVFTIQNGINLGGETSKSDFVSKKSIGGYLWANKHLNKEEGYQ